MGWAFHFRLGVASCSHRWRFQCRCSVSGLWTSKIWRNWIVQLRLLFGYFGCAWGSTFCCARDRSSSSICRISVLLPDRRTTAALRESLPNTWEWYPWTLSWCFRGDPGVCPENRLVGVGEAGRQKFEGICRVWSSIDGICVREGNRIGKFE